MKSPREPEGIRTVSNPLAKLVAGGTMLFGGSNLAEASTPELPPIVGSMTPDNSPTPADLGEDISDRVGTIDATETDNSAEAQIDTTRTKLEEQAQSATTEADKMAEQLIAGGILTSEELTQLKTLMDSDDEAGIHKFIEDHAPKAASEGEEGSKQFILLLSFLGLAYFANMMFRCAKDGAPISFLKHHLPFAAGLLAMGTQLPHEIIHGLIESGVAFVAVMGITRLSRGVTNKVDFNEFNEDQAKAVIFSLGWFGSIFNSLTTSTVLAPLAGKLKKKDRYIAVQNLANIDGGVFGGAFPGLVAINKLGMTNGPLFQLGLMAPIMLFQKIYQGILWRPNLIKHAGLIRDVLFGMSYDGALLGHKNTEIHERHLVEEIVADLKDKIAGLREELGPDYNEVLTAIDEGQTAILSRDLKGQDSAGKVDEYTATQEAKAELEGYLANPEFAQFMGTIAVTILEAMHNGHITKDEVLALKNTGDLDRLHHKLKAHQPKGAEEQVNTAFARFGKVIAASHNEMEIMRVFTVQVLAVPLLIPAVGTMLHNFPVLTETFTGLTTAFADNYAACAMTWEVDPAKALAVAICFGGATIYGNMPNLNFLGKDANLMDSIKAAKYLIPTAAALVAYLNIEVGGKTLATHAGEFAQSLPANAAEISRVVVDTVNKTLG